MLLFINTIRATNLNYKRVIPLSIKKRLLLSNIGMIVIPIFFFFVMEIILGYILFVVFKGDPEGIELKWFISGRFFGMLLILALTNGLLTYYVSKSILTPIRKLSNAAKEISEGNLDYSIASTKTDELGHLSNTFEMMRQHLKEAKTVQTRYEQNHQELIASISHDVKTPLTSIKGYVRGIQDGVANTPEKLDHYMETIYKKANEMDALIDELFQYSKLDLARVPFQFEDIDIYSYFSDFVNELNFQLENDRGSAVLSANKDDSYIVKADREQLNRVVTNITQNSLKYMDKGCAEIQVQLMSQQTHVAVEIKDNGVGVPSKDLSSIFDPFFRTDTSRNSSTGGSGLGLAISKKIIEEHGGSIWAHSEKGKSTSIHFTLRKGIFREKDTDH